MANRSSFVRFFFHSETLRELRSSFVTWCETHPCCERIAWQAVSYCKYEASTHSVWMEYEATECDAQQRREKKTFPLEPVFSTGALILSTKSAERFFSAVRVSTFFFSKSFPRARATHENDRAHIFVREKQFHWRRTTRTTTKSQSTCKLWVLLLLSLLLLLFDVIIEAPRLLLCIAYFNSTTHRPTPSFTFILVVPFDFRWIVIDFFDYVPKIHFKIIKKWYGGSDSHSHSHTLFRLTVSFIRPKQ